jgi:CheY-like chemotaxis protein
MLTASGHAVESAPNGSAGLSRLTAVLGTPDDFDVVLCDFQMPVRTAGLPLKSADRVHRVGIFH